MILSLQITFVPSKRSCKMVHEKKNTKAVLEANKAETSEAARIPRANEYM